MENSLGEYADLAALDAVVSGHQTTTQSLSPTLILRTSLYPNPSRPVTTILMLTLRKLASEPKDRVFALHSVFQRLGARLSAPDYDRNIEDVFCEATRLAIGQDKSLCILSYVNDLNKPQTWPSWVPAWSETIGPSPVEVNCFNAAGTSRPSYSFSPDGWRLTVRGTVVDTVMMKTERSPMLGMRSMMAPEEGDIADARGTEAKIKAYQDWIKTFHMFSTLSTITGTNKYGDRSKHDKAFIRVLLQDFTTIPGSYTQQQEVFDAYLNWKRYLSATLLGTLFPMSKIEADLRPHDEKASRLPESLHHLTQTNEWKILRAIEEDPNTAKFERQVILGNRSKTFFATKGGYYGTAPSSIQFGDSLVLVSGLQVPLIMRAVGEGQSEFKLLGPAYVQGVMYGEVWPRGENQLKEFTIV
jgi:hypothetical protein